MLLLVAVIDKEIFGDLRIDLAPLEPKTYLVVDGHLENTASPVLVVDPVHKLLRADLAFTHGILLMRGSRSLGPSLCF